jgi:hypothetical protein
LRKEEEEKQKLRQKKIDEKEMEEAKKITREMDLSWVSLKLLNF